MVLLTIDSVLGRIAAHCLASQFAGLHILVEERVSRWALLRGRVSRLGLTRVAGQLAFMACGRVIARLSRPRIRALIARFAMDDRWPDNAALIRVPSVNSSACVAALCRIDPQVVLVVGTRVIRRELLVALPVPFINYHAGITPKYRGVHGGYWANVEDDLENFGVTVHLIDTGIDTGAVLYQSRIRPEPQDNYATFPYLQLAAGLPLLKQAALDALDAKLAPKAVDLRSRIWSHPTIWCYVMGGLKLGAW